MGKQVTMSFEEYDNDLMQAKTRGEHDALIQYQEFLRNAHLEATEEAVQNLLQSVHTGDMNKVLRLNCRDTEGLKVLVFVLSKGLAKITEEQNQKSVDNPPDIVVESVNK